MNKTIKKISTIDMFKQAIKNFLLLGKAPKRASRKEYWVFVSIALPAVLVACLISLILFRSLVLGCLLGLISYIVLFHLSIRRCHDVGIISAPAYLAFFGTILGSLITSEFSQEENFRQTAEYVEHIKSFIMIFVIVNTILLVVTMLPGSPGKNHFGNKPTT